MTPTRNHCSNFYYSDKILYIFALRWNCTVSRPLYNLWSIIYLPAKKDSFFTAPLKSVRANCCPQNLFDHKSFPMTESFVLPVILYVCVCVCVPVRHVSAVTLSVIGVLNHCRLRHGTVTLSLVKPLRTPGCSRSQVSACN